MTSKDNFLEYQAQTSPFPIAIQIERAKGIYLYDQNGKKYFDLISGIAVDNVGHSHPKVVEAIKNQVDKYLHVMAYGEFVQQPQVDLAKKLISLLPPNLEQVYFVNSGTEANEAALKLAKRVTGRTELVACNRSYHGSTHGSLSVTGNDTKKWNYRPLLPGVKFMEFNDLTSLDVISENTAGVIVETIQGDAGVRIPSIEYLTALRKKCDETGALLIFDEVQTGFGRTGKLFAFEHYGIYPDILTIAKGMGGGMPIGAFVSSKKYMKELTYDPILGHITTFGGNPVCCAASLATMEVIESENLLEKVEEKGLLIKELLSKNSSIVEIRQKGLMLAIDMESTEIVQKVVTKCLERGVISFWFLSCPWSFRLAPPLVITEEEIREACAIIVGVIEEVNK